MFSFRCPNCKRRLRVKPQYCGRRVKCPACSVSLTIPVPKLKFTCPTCDNLLSVPSDTKEKFIDCPKCSAVVPVPGKETVAAPAAKKPRIESALAEPIPKIDHISGDTTPETDTDNLDDLDKLAASSCYYKTWEEPPPERPNPWPLDIFLFPISTSGLTVTGLVVALPILVDLVAFLTCIPFIILIAGFLFVKIPVALYYYWFLAICVRYSAEGQIRAPYILGETPSIGETFFCWLKIFGLALLFAALPIAYSTRTDQLGAFFWIVGSIKSMIFPTGLLTVIATITNNLSDTNFWLLALLGWLIFPAALLSMVLADSLVQGVNPFFFLQPLIKTPLQYFSLLLFGLASFAVPVTAVIAFHGHIFAILVFSLPLIYLSLVWAHLLGRLYYRNREKFDWDID